MFGLDNKSGINVMPTIAPADSQSPLWFTEGGAGLSATYPGQDWFNQIQAELLNALKAADIAPQKGSLNQLSSAISKLASAYAVSIVHTTGPSLTSVMSQKAVTDELKKKVDQAKYINDGANLPAEITSQGTGFYRTSATVTGTNVDSQLGYSLFWAINLSGNIGALCVNHLGTLYFSNDCKIWERAATINDIKAVTDITELDGSKTIASQILGNLVTSKKTNAPYPSDTPVGGRSFKILQVGDNSWPSLLLFDSYANRAFLTTRTAPSGSLNKFSEFAMLDNVLGNGQRYVDVTSSRYLNSQYTNSTGRTIFVMVTISRTSGSSVADVKIDGVNIGAGVSAVTGGTASNTVCFPVPSDSTYSVSVRRGGEIGITWVELRS